MGQFTKTIRKRGAFLYGSRAFGVASNQSDWDWAMLNSYENMRLLLAYGFKQEKEEYRARPRVRGWRPITSVPGLQGELFMSYRKGNTNVVLMSAFLLEATRHSTQMLKSDRSLTATKEDRVRGYQMFSEQYARMMGRA